MKMDRKEKWITALLLALLIHGVIIAFFWINQRHNKEQTTSSVALINSDSNGHSQNVSTQNSTNHTGKQTEQLSTHSNTHTIDADSEVMPAILPTTIAATQSSTPTHTQNPHEKSDKNNARPSPLSQPTMMAASKQESPHTPPSSHIKNAVQTAESSQTLETVQIHNDDGKGISELSYLKNPNDIHKKEAEHINDDLLIDFDLPKATPKSSHQDYQEMKSEAQKLHDELTSHIEKVKKRNQQKINEQEQYNQPIKQEKDTPSDNHNHDEQPSSKTPSATESHPTALE